jgi:hypothetical protein
MLSGHDVIWSREFEYDSLIELRINLESKEMCYVDELGYWAIQTLQFEFFILKGNEQQFLNLDLEQLNELRILLSLGFLEIKFVEFLFPKGDNT